MLLALARAEVFDAERTPMLLLRQRVARPANRRRVVVHLPVLESSRQLRLRHPDDETTRRR